MVEEATGVGKEGFNVLVGGTVGMVISFVIVLLSVDLFFIVINLLLSVFLIR